MRSWLVLIAVLVACKGQEQAKPTKAGHDEHDEHITKSQMNLGFTEVCGSALDSARTVPLNARPKLLLDRCQVCEGWNTILSWNLDGTKPEQLQKALELCGAFCNGDAKMKFIAGANEAKGTTNDTPWKRLGDACGDRVDASSDHRFMSAPYFALGRIGAAAPEKKLDDLVLPLPALTVAGTGLALPELDDSVSPEAGELVVSVIGETVHLGRLPHAKLGNKGLLVELGDPPYPGKELKLTELGAALTAAGAAPSAGSAGSSTTGSVPTNRAVLLAPRAMPAAKLVPIVAAVGSGTRLYLGVASADSPAGWQLPAAAPYPLQIGKDGIKVTAEMTVQNLAAELAVKRSGTLQGP